MKTLQDVLDFTNELFTLCKKKEYEIPGTGESIIDGNASAVDFTLVIYPGYSFPSHILLSITIILDWGFKVRWQCVDDDIYGDIGTAYNFEFTKKITR